MAKQLGTNVDSEDAAMVAGRKEFDDKKKALADAFARKARALAEVEDILGETRREEMRFRDKWCSLIQSCVSLVLLQY